MINPKQLLNDLKRVLRGLEDDIRERAGADDGTDARLRREHAEARRAERTAATFNAWRDEQVTQSAVAWILGCVFVRFLEDNDLVSTVWLSGPGDHLSLARDREMLFYRGMPTASERDYLQNVFQESAKLATLAELFDESHNPLWRLPPSGDGARELLHFFRKANPDTGELDHDFSDPEWNTRFLGDLYQDLSEAARKKFALLQTPEFVEEFILDRTLTPAIETFGLREVRLIDVTCGSGHFLLGTFRRILEQWLRLEPGTNVRDLTQRALDAVYGVDLNPFAVAIARFRLLIEALRACDIRKLEDALAFRFNLAVGDSLLHGVTHQQFMPGFEDSDPIGFVYETEDADELRRILKQHYHAVVGNPPYITVKDKALNEAYRDRYGSCHRQYSLAVPFMERFFGLALAKRNDEPAGFVGMITSNSFMKREFGKKLVEEYIPKWDLTHVIDTSGTYLPGHDTPTAIIFGQNRSPILETVRAVLGIRGEPGVPADPAAAKVWSAILAQVDDPGSETEYISVSDVSRDQFRRHPWSVRGGGATRLKTQLEETAKAVLVQLTKEVGSCAVTREDDAFCVGRGALLRHRVPAAYIKNFPGGESVRDWSIREDAGALWPYNSESLTPECSEGTTRFLWRCRSTLRRRVAYSESQIERGLRWFEYSMFFRERYRAPFLMAFGEIATHNHFSLRHDRSVFRHTAPVMILPQDATVEQHFELLGLLNSSTGLFWLRQVCFPKGGDRRGGQGARVTTTPYEERYAYDGTKLKQFPVPSRKPLALPRELDRLGHRLADTLPDPIVTNWHVDTATRGQTPLRKAFEQGYVEFTAIREKMIALQEELDWQCYYLYGLTDKKLWLEDIEAVPSIKLGERTFEILMARQMARGTLETTWFERHGSTPITQPPQDWSEDYLALYHQRHVEMQENKNIRLIEKPEYKRRWQMEPWEKQVEKALYEWLANRLEYGLSGRDLMLEAAATASPNGAGAQARSPGAASDEGAVPLPLREPELLSCAQLAERLHADAEFQEVAALYTGRPDFDLTRLVIKLVEGEGVPNLPRFRYKESGLRKRADWEQAWQLQREEDALGARSAELGARIAEAKKAGKVEEAAGLLQEQAAIDRQIKDLDIPVPPKYQSADFQNSDYWRLRGKLDVPKERFIVYPGAEREGDPTPVLTWAGWDHLQQAQALAAWYTQLQDAGASEDKLLLTLVGIGELLPWIKQWHNEINASFDMRMGDFFQEFVDGEARQFGTTLDELLV